MKMVFVFVNRNMPIEVAVVTKSRTKRYCRWMLFGAVDGGSQER